MDLVAQVHDRISLLMARQALSPSDLDRLAGFSRGFTRKLLRRSIDLKTLERLAVALGAPILQVPHTRRPNSKPVSPSALRPKKIIDPTHIDLPPDEFDQLLSDL